MNKDRRVLPIECDEFELARKTKKRTFPSSVGLKQLILNNDPKKSSILRG